MLGVVLALAAVARAEVPVDPVSQYLSDGDEITELEKSLHLARSIELRDFVKKIVRNKVRHELKQDGIDSQTIRKAQKARQNLNRLYELVTTYQVPQVNTRSRMNLLKSLMRPPQEAPSRRPVKPRAIRGRASRARGPNQRVARRAR